MHYHYSQHIPIFLAAQQIIPVMPEIISSGQTDRSRFIYAFTIVNRTCSSHTFLAVASFFILT